MAHARQSRPDYGLDFQTKQVKTSKVFPLRSAADTIVAFQVFESNTDGGSGSEAGSYLRLIDFVYHSTLGLRPSPPHRCTFLCTTIAQKKRWRRVPRCLRSVEAMGAMALPPICDSSFTCEDYNTYRAHPWSPFPLRRAHPGPGLHMTPFLFLCTTISQKKCWRRATRYLRSTPD